MRYSILDRMFAGKVLVLAFPVILGLMSQTLLGLVDTAMVGRLGAEALAATGFGSAVFMTLVNFFGALGIGTQALTARRYGEGDTMGSGKVLSNALMISLLIGIPLTLTGFFFSSHLFPLISEDAAVVTYGIGYLEYRFFGMAFMLINVALSRFFNGIGNTRIYMNASLIINGLNIVLDYLLIFGNFGFPRLEVTGAAIASTLATMIGTGYYLIAGMKKTYFNNYNYFNTKNLEWKNSLSIARISFPPGVQSLLTTAGFLTFLWIIGQVGTTEVAATIIIVRITAVALTSAFGFGIAAATLIGQYMGAEDPGNAEKSVWESAKIGGLFLGLFALAFVALPEPIIRVFTNDPKTIYASICPLIIIGLVQLFDAYRIVLGQALQAAGNPRWVMFMEVSVNWFVLLPLTYLLAKKSGLGLVGAWISMDVFVLVLAMSMIWKFRQGRWKKIQL